MAGAVRGGAGGTGAGVGGWVRWRPEQGFIYPCIFDATTCLFCLSSFGDGLIPLGANSSVLVALLAEHEWMQFTGLRALAFLRMNLPE